MSNEERKQGLAVPQSSDVDERKKRMRQLANVYIELFLDWKKNQSATPAALAEVA